MTPHAYSSHNPNSNEDKVMNPAQFERVMTAIVEGKYSWACVLVLRFAGYNPAHFIPYRTYKRLIRSNRKSNTEKSTANATSSNQAYQALVDTQSLE
ncbi:MAG: HetP family heterocyst commitment protein [Leptolyngbya sp. SIO1D8]|nr:HetP family heterocyst commitment protein [Leptolyngbya sp. SIO1D8]